MASSSMEALPLEGMSSTSTIEVPLHRENPSLYVENAHLVTTVRADLARAAAESQIMEFAHPLVEFTIFNKLPVDLRVTVWEWASIDPRVVDVLSNEKERNNADDKERLYSNTIVPVVMHVNSDSRAAGMRWYNELTFGGPEKTTFINWKRDVVYFTNGLALREFIKMETAIETINRVVQESLKAQTTIKAKNFVEHSAINVNCRRLAVKFKDIDWLKGTVQGVHFPEVQELIVVRYDRSTKNKASTPNKLFDIEGIGSARAAAHMESQARRHMKSGGALKKVLAKDVSRDKRVPLSKEESNQREDEMMREEIERRSRFNDDLLVAATFQDELHKRAPK